jgi:hypothetical protein
VGLELPCGRTGILEDEVELQLSYVIPGVAQ